MNAARISCPDQLSEITRPGLSSSCLRPEVIAERKSNGNVPSDHGITTWRWEQNRREERACATTAVAGSPATTWGIQRTSPTRRLRLSLIHISEPTRLGMISYAVFCLK